MMQVIDVKASQRGKIVRWVLHTLSQRLGQGQRATLQSVMVKSEKWNLGSHQSGKTSWRREGLGLVLLIKADAGVTLLGAIVTHHPSPLWSLTPPSRDLPPTPCLCVYFSLSPWEPRNLMKSISFMQSLLCL